MLGSYFRAFRLQHGLTQTQVGRLLYVHEATVAFWESGRVPVADYAKAWMQRLSPALCDINGPMTAAGCAWHLQHRGWTQADLARAMGYTVESGHRWCRGIDRVPGRVADWLRAQPQYPQTTQFYPSASGLRKYLRRQYMKPLELAQWCGVSEATIFQWCDGLRPLPPSIQAWMRAGCPRSWRFRPPGLEPNIVVGHGKPIRVANLRTIQTSRYTPPRVWTNKPKRRSPRSHPATWAVSA